MKHYMLPIVAGVIFWFGFCALGYLLKWVKAESGSKESTSANIGCFIFGITTSVSISVFVFLLMKSHL